MNISIRFAVPEDAGELLAIYRPYVEKTPITFEYEVPSAEEFAGRIRDFSSFYPYLVCEREGKILGYAYAHRHQSRAAYQWGAELSIYMDEAARGLGIGPRLYRALMDLLALQNVQNLYACITSPNERSQRMHEALGFSLCGIWKHSGYKLGAWHDVAWYQRRADMPGAAVGANAGHTDAANTTAQSIGTENTKAARNTDDVPKPLISVHDLDPDAAAAVFTAHFPG